MDSISAWNSTHNPHPGFDTRTPSYPESQGGVIPGQSLLPTPPPDALGRPYPLHHASDDPSPTTTITTSFGGILDSPLVQIKSRNAAIPLSPPPSQPTMQVRLPPFNPTFDDDFSNIHDSSISNLGFGKPEAPGLSYPSLETYSPPLSPVGESPSFTSLALSLAPITHRGEGSLVPSTSPPPTSHEGAIITGPSPDGKVLLSPLSPEWDTDLVDEDESEAPLSIHAVLSGVDDRGGKRVAATQTSKNEDEGELDDLGLADDEDGRDSFAFAGFLTRGSSRPRLSMLEIPPSAYPTSTLSPSSYYPSATSAITSSLWTVDATSPTSPISSSSTLWSGTSEGGDDDLASKTAQTTPIAPFALFSDEEFAQHGSSSPHVGTVDLFPSFDEDDSFNAYHSPQLQYTALPGLLSSPHVSFHDLPADEYAEPTLLLSSNDRHPVEERQPSPVGHSLGLDLDSIQFHSTCHDGESASLLALLEKYQEAEKDARVKENEAMAAIAAIRSPSVSASRLSPTLENDLQEALEGSGTHTTQEPSISPSLSISELQRIAADARRAGKKARARAKEVSALLKIKSAQEASSSESSLFPISPIDPLLDSPSPPMLFEPLDDTTVSSTTHTHRPAISPPFGSLQMDGFATSPPIFGSGSSNKSLSRKRKGGVDHLVAKMILGRREAGSNGGSTSSSSVASSYANAKPVFLSPLLGHHHQLQLQQRYKFLRSSPLARNVVTLASPRAPSLSSMPTPLPLSSSLLDGEAPSNGPYRSNSLDSTCSTDTACSTSSSLWSEWDSDGETSWGEEDDDAALGGSSKRGGLLGSLDEEDEDEDADEDVEMGFQALKTPLMWGMDLAFDSGFEQRSGLVGEDDVEEEGRYGLLPAL